MALLVVIIIIIAAIAGGWWYHTTRMNASASNNANTTNMANSINSPNSGNNSPANNSSAVRNTLVDPNVVAVNNAINSAVNNAPNYQNNGVVGAGNAGTSANLNGNAANGSNMDPLAGYIYYTGQESSYSDIGYHSDLVGDPAALALECNQDPNCVGFTTSGMLKSGVWPQSDWSPVDTGGMYVHENVDVNKHQYDFHQGKDSSSSGLSGEQADLYRSIAHMPELKDDKLALMNACNQTQGCNAFNTNGYLKGALRPSNEWSTWTTDPDKGMFTKIHDSATTAVDDMLVL